MLGSAGAAEYSYNGPRMPSAGPELRPYCGVARLLASVRQAEAELAAGAVAKADYNALQHELEAAQAAARTEAAKAAAEVGFAIAASCARALHPVACSSKRHTWRSPR